MSNVMCQNKVSFLFFHLAAVDFSMKSLHKQSTDKQLKIFTENRSTRRFYQDEFRLFHSQKVKTRVCNKKREKTTTIKKPSFKGNRQQNMNIEHKIQCETFQSILHLLSHSFPLSRWRPNSLSCVYVPLCT